MSYYEKHDWHKIPAINNSWVCYSISRLFSDLILFSYYILSSEFEKSTGQSKIAELFIRVCVFLYDHTTLACIIQVQQEYSAFSNTPWESQNGQGMAWELSWRRELCHCFPNMYSFSLLVHSHFYHNQFTISLLKSSSFRFTPCWISASSGSSNFCISELNCSNSFKGMEA